MFSCVCCVIHIAKKCKCDNSYSQCIMEKVQVLGVSSWPLSISSMLNFQIAFELFSKLMEELM
jgi:hypothetical protein